MKKWYQSKTMMIAGLLFIQQSMQYATGEYFPNAPSQLIAIINIVGLAVPVALAYVRTRPDHGESLTVKQHLAKIKQP